MLFNNLILIIGIPKEIKHNEKRISLIPNDVKLLIDNNIKVYVESDAGINAGYTNNDYIKHGAIICNTSEELYNLASIIVKVKEPQEEEYKYITDKHVILAFFHFAGNPGLLETMIKNKTTCIAYETIQLNNIYPILSKMSKIAGEQAIIQGLKYIDNNININITIIGGGNVGRAAAIKCKELNYNNITILEKDINKIDILKKENLNAIQINNDELKKYISNSNIIIGCIYNTGKEADKIITNELLDLMPNNSIFVDIAIDQGGMTEQSKPTTIDNPIINYKNIKLYCVPNIPSVIPYDSSIELSNSITPYLINLLNLYTKIISGINIFNGNIIHNSLLCKN